MHAGSQSRSPRKLAANSTLAPEGHALAEARPIRSLHRICLSIPLEGCFFPLQADVRERYVAEIIEIVSEPVNRSGTTVATFLGKHPRRSVLAPCHRITERIEGWPSGLCATTQACSDRWPIWRRCCRIPQPAPSLSRSIQADSGPPNRND